MRFISLLIKSSWKTFIVSCVSSVLTGLFSTLVIRTIHDAVTTSEFSLNEFITNFLIFITGYGISSFIASYSVALLTQSIIHKLRIDFSQKILKAPFRLVEQAQPKLLAILTEDIKTIALSMDRLPGVTTGTATVIGILSYLVYYSPTLTIATILLFACVFLFTKLLLPLVKKYSDLSRNYLNDLYLKFEGLVFGIKELTLNKEFKHSYISREIKPSSEVQNKFALKESVVSAFANRITDLVLFFGLGIMIVTIFKTGFVDLEFFGEYLTLVLFTLAPLSTASGFLTSLRRIETSLEQIDSLGFKIDDKAVDIQSSLISDIDLSKDMIQLDGVGYEYQSIDGEKAFHLGPIDLTIKKGDTVFLVGGNGSGKTTLAKMICGLYDPNTGSVSYHGQKIDKTNLSDYRSQFATVFSDSYVFTHLYHVNPEILENKGDYLINLLELKGKVQIIDQQFTTKKLSDGQKKRLSLIQAILEDKEIYLLDEWAAHQDPHFKETFYNIIIPYLQEMNKTTIVITHDDRYFDKADHVIKMRDGVYISEVQDINSEL